MPDYYHLVRSEIAPLLPERVARVLDVGCGAGRTLAWLKRERPGVETTGVEPNPGVAGELRGNADHAFSGRIEDLDPAAGPFDLVLCLDVLEHLHDPAATLRALVARLAPGGRVIVSVPNVAHLSVSAPLLLRRRFPYADAGILDRTHVTFFVEDSLLAFLNGAGLIAEAGLLSGMQGPKSRLLDRVTGGLLRHHLTKQYIVRCARGSDPQPKVEWRVI